MYCTAICFLPTLDTHTYTFTIRIVLANGLPAVFGALENDACDSSIPTLEL